MVKSIASTFSLFMAAATTTCAVAGCALALAQAPPPSPGPTVDLGYATYQGYYDETYDLNVWKG